MPDEPAAGELRNLIQRARLLEALGGDYTPRLMPFHPEAGTPIEARRILWQP